MKYFSILMILILLKSPISSLAQLNHGTGNIASTCDEIHNIATKIRNILNKYYPRKKVLKNNIDVIYYQDIIIPEKMPSILSNDRIRQKPEYDLVPRFQTNDEAITFIIFLTYELQFKELKEINDEKELRVKCGEKKVNEVLRNNPWLKKEPTIFELLEELKKAAFSRANKCNIKWSAKELNLAIEFLKIWVKDQIPEETPEEKKLKRYEEIQIHKNKIINQVNGFQG